MQQIKDGVAAGYQKLLDEREYHIRRDQEILLTIIQSEAAARLELKQGHEVVLAERNAVFMALEQTIADLDQGLKRNEEENKRLAKENEELMKHISQLEDVSRKNNLLLEQYQEKNGSLSAQLTDYQDALEENKVLHQKMTELNRQMEKQSSAIRLLEHEQQQNEKWHMEELGRLKEGFEVQREKEVLKVRSECQDKIEKAMNEVKGLYEQLYLLRGGSGGEEKQGNQS